MHHHHLSQILRGTAAAVHLPRADEREAWADAWRSGTDQARRRTPELRVDLSYGRRAGERFDLYLPGHGARGRPFAAYVHDDGAREQAGFPAKAMHRHGMAFVALGFDGSPELALADQADQIRRAWEHLVTHAGRLGLDPARGHLLGHGAGARLAALAAPACRAPGPVSLVLVSPTFGADPGVAPDRVDGPPGLADRRQAAGDGPADVVYPGLSPATRVVVAWGELESPARREHAARLARAWRARRHAVIAQPLEGRDRFGTSLELADPHSPVLATVRAGR